MTSERRLNANRANAKKSKGPRSAAGKLRSSRNATVHGLTAAPRVSNADEVEKLTRKVAGESASAIQLEYARSFAWAQLDIDRIRQFKIALLDFVLKYGAFGRPYLNPLSALEPIVFTRREIARIQRVLDRKPTSLRMRVAKQREPMPTGADASTAEAFRRASEVLFKIDAYERRAAAHRDRCLRQFLRSSRQLRFLQNEPNFL